MKPKFRSLIASFAPLSRTSLLVCASFCGVSTSQAATITRLNNATTLDLAGAWNGGVVPIGTDIAQWNNAMTATGATINLAGPVTFGELQITNPTVGITIGAGGGTLVLNGLGGIGIDMSTATQNLTINAPMSLGGTQIWTAGSGRTLTTVGILAGGAVGLTLNGPGTFQFNGAQDTYSGTTTVNGAQLFLRYLTLNNNLSNASSLASGGGNVDFAAQGTGNNITSTQAFTGLTVNTGQAYFSQGRGSGDKMIVNLGTVARGAGSTGIGGTINFSPTSNNSLFSTTSASANNIIGGWATYNFADFAKGAATAGTVTTIVAPAYTNDTWGAANNTTVTVASNGAYNNVTTNSLRFAAVASDTVNLTGINVISSGGILVSTLVTAAFTDTITGGTLEGAANTDLIVHQHGAGTLAINSIIADNTTSTALTKSGGGLLTLGGANTFTGGIYLNAGQILLTTGGSLNSNTVTFTNNSNAILSLGGVSTSVGSLNTTSILPTTAPIVQNSNSSSSALTLTSNSVTPTTYIGTIQDGGGGGTLSLVKSGTSTQTLGGTLSYTGATTVNNGILKLNSTPSATSAFTLTSPGNLDVSALAGNNLTLTGSQKMFGTGVVTGKVTGSNLTTFAPGTGTATTGGSGTLTVGTLALASGSVVNLGLNAGNPSNSLISATTLTLPASGSVVLNLYTPGTSTPFATAGSYNLFQYTTLTNGTLPSNVFTLGTSIAGFTPSYSLSGGFVVLTLTSTGINGIWTGINGDTNWGTPGNWSTAIPSVAGDSATFSQSNATPGTVTLNSGRTVATVAFNTTSGSFAITGANTLTFDNTGSGASITNAGNNSLGTLVALNDNLTVAATGTVTISGDISENAAGKSLTKSLGGTLILSGANSYTGGTFITGGVLNFAHSATNDGDLGATATPVSLLGSTLQWATGNADNISLTRTITIGAGGATFDTNGNNVTFTNAVGNAGSGALTKAGAGTLVLAAGNTYTGANTITGGTLNLLADTSLGAVPGAAATNLTINGGTTLKFGASITLNANRSIVYGSGTATVDTNGLGVVILGATSGPGLFYKVGAGTLAMTGACTGNGGLTIDAGTLAVNSNANFPTGTLTLNGTAGITTTTTTGLGNNPVVVNGTNFITGNSTTIQTLNVVTGNGTLTFGGPYVNDYSGNLTAFTGTIIENAGGFRFNGSTGAANVTFNLANSGASVRSNAATITLGALAGNAVANLSGSGGGATQAVTYIIGAKTVGGLGVTPVDSIYNGTFGNGTSTTAISKVGLSTLTLGSTTNSTFTGGTVINAGMIVANGAQFVTLFGTSNGTTAAVTVNNTATLKLTTSDCLGGNHGILAVNSNPVTINQGGLVTSNGSFNATWNLKINGGELRADGGSINTNFGAFGLKGTVTIGGTVASIITKTAAANSVINVGDVVAGNSTTFNVPDITSSVATDLTVSVPLADFPGAVTPFAPVASGLTKSGVGTMVLSVAPTYTGDTTVLGGTLSLPTATSLADTSSVLLTTNTVLDLPYVGIDTVAKLFIDGVQQLTGTWGSPTSGAAHTSTLFTGTGKLQVGSDPYENWILGFYPGSTNPAIIGHLADPDSDGVANMVEYLLSSSPANGAQSNLPTSVTSGTNLIFTYTRLKEAVTAGFIPTVEYSSTLDIGSWTTATAGMTGVVDNGTTETVTVTIPIPVGVTDLFARLIVTKQP